ncbi:MAG: 2-amino-4-hydroxy-6-hydroxymethyldihydropteridine diphosphokinase [Bacteroidota bacterium]
MARVFLGLGSNVGDRLRFLQRAVDELRSRDGVVLTKVSSVYETEPVGVKDQRDFLNLALEVEVLLAPEELLRTVKEVEKKVGRKPAERWGPREIDIDILLYNDQTTNVGELRIPHPELAQRKFVLVPLQELDGQLVHPVQRQTVGELLKMCMNDSGVRKSALTIVL